MALHCSYIILSIVWLVLHNLAVAFISSFNPSQFPSFHSLQPYGFSFRSTSASHSFLSWGPRSHYSPARNTLLQFLGQHLPLILMISVEMSPAQRDFPSSSSLVIYSLLTHTISKLFSCWLSPPLDCKLMQGRGLLNEWRNHSKSYSSSAPSGSVNTCWMNELKSTEKGDNKTKCRNFGNVCILQELEVEEKGMLMREEEETEW